MPGDDSYKWRYSQEHRVSDVEEATELAEKFRQDGTYNWFRGQTKPWPPHTALARAHTAGQAQLDLAGVRFLRLLTFVELHPELQQIRADKSAFLAVAQHYGIPTPYLDFTTEPAIAVSLPATHKTLILVVTAVFIVSTLTTSMKLGKFLTPQHLFSQPLPLRRKSSS
jgi:hypothetical protein